jgi:Leucine-rich repeat (LRR) protein
MNTPKTLSAVDEIVNELRFLQSNMENNEEFLKVLAIMVDQVESLRPLLGRSLASLLRGQIG